MIKYDTPIEVTKEQYDYLRIEFAGALAHREHEGKYYVKLWFMQYRKHLERYLGMNKPVSAADVMGMIEKVADSVIPGNTNPQAVITMVSTENANEFIDAKA